MKVTVIKGKNVKDNSSLIYSFIMLVFGFILLFNAEQFITTLFIIFGALILVSGIFRFYQYIKQKKELNIEDSNALLSGVCGCAVGLLTIFLSSILNNALQIITGLWLFMIGLNKIKQAILFQEEQTFLIQNILGAIIFITLGIYSIFAKNVLFMIVGIFLIITAVVDILQFYKK